MGAVAAAYKENMLHGAGLDGLDELGRLGEDGAVGKTGGEHVTAVDAAHAAVVLVAPQRQRLLNEGGEILAVLLVAGDVPQALVAHHGGGVDAVGVAGAGRHEAVGGEEHRRGNIFKFFLLALPRGAEVARQMGIFFKRRITMGREHLAVGMDVDALAGRLLQQLVQILQIVGGHHDEGAFFDVGVHPRGDGVAEGGGVSAVQQRHTLEIHLPELHDERQPLLHGVGAVQLAQPLIKPRRHLGILAAEVQAVVGVGGHALQAEEERGAEGNGVGIPLPKLHKGSVPAAQLLPLGGHPLREAADGGAIKIYVGEGGEQAVHQQTVGFFGAAAAFFGRQRKAHEFIDEFVLQIGGFGLLAADPRADAAGAAGGLLTLKAKHF